VDGGHREPHADGRPDARAVEEEQDRPVDERVVSSVRTLRRRPSSRPIARALTASGGAMAAPSTIAVLIVSAGTTPAATAAAAKAVATTSSTPSRRIGTSRRTNDVNENASAVE
jgi:hypothetical protein